MESFFCSWGSTFIGTCWLVAKDFLVREGVISLVLSSTSVNDYSTNACINVRGDVEPF